MAMGWHTGVFHNTNKISLVKLIKIVFTEKDHFYPFFQCFNNYVALNRSPQNTLFIFFRIFKVVMCIKFALSVKDPVPLYGAQK